MNDLLTHCSSLVLEHDVQEHDVLEHDVPEHAVPEHDVSHAAPVLDRAAEARALEAVESLLHEVCDVASGTLLEAAREHLETGGKRMRARLALSAASALDLPLAQVVPWAAACEMLHNASLIHDDLQDGDTVRRGRPTTWVRYGTAQAVNAGDLLLMLPYVLLERLPADDGVRWRLSRALARRAAETVGGQAAELDLHLGADRLADDYLRVIRGKTSALLALPVYGAAVLAGFSDSKAEALADAFRPLGLLFQLQDDVIDLYGDKGRDAVGCDIREGKVSALVVEHLRLAPADRQRLVTLLRTPREATSEADVDWCVQRFRASGALDAVLDQIDALTRAVEHAPALLAAPDLHDVALAGVRQTLLPLSPLLRARRGRVA